MIKKGKMLLKQFSLEEKRSAAAPTKVGAAENASSPGHTANYMPGLDFLILACFEKEFNPIGLGKIYGEMFLTFTNLLSYLSQFGPVVKIKPL
jgi:hypothetical protein